MERLFDSLLTQQRVQKHTIQRIEEKTLAAAVAGVWLDGRQVCNVALGWRDPLNSVPVSQDTIFRLASMTKPVTGTAVMQLWEKELIGLDDPISKWIPCYANMQIAAKIEGDNVVEVSPAQKEMTIRMLLTHSGGVGSGQICQLQYEDFCVSKYGSLAEAVDGYADSLLEFEPGTNQNYSGIQGMDILARIVEIVSDMPYEEYLKKNLFIPLGMKDTTYCPNEEQQERLMEMIVADGDFHAVGMSKGSGFADFPDGYTGGGAGLFSTLEDYSHLAMMFLNNGCYDGTHILKSSTVDLMATPQLPDSFPGIGPLFNWGLSMRVCSEQKAPEQPLSPGTFGWSGAYGTHFWVDRAKNLVAVYMSNIHNGMGAGAPTAFEFERDVMAGFGECE